MRGIFSRPDHKLAGESYVGRVLVLDAAKGGVATAWMLREMTARGIMPAALVLNAVNPIMVQGAALADFTMISGFDVDITQAIPNGAIGRGRPDRRATIHPYGSIARVGRNSVSPRLLVMTLSGHAGGLDHGSDAGNLALDQLLQGGGAAVRALGRRAAELDVTLLDRGIIERLAECVRELSDDLVRCALGGNHRVPGTEDEVDSGFPGRRHVGQAREPLGGRDGVNLDGASLDLRDDVERLVDHVVDLASDEVADGRPGAAIGYEIWREAELRVENEPRHMGDRADAGVAVGELRIVDLEVVDKLFQSRRGGVFLATIDCGV